MKTKVVKLRLNKKGLPCGMDVRRKQANESYLLHMRLAWWLGAVKMFRWHL